LRINDEVIYEKYEEDYVERDGKEIAASFYIAKSF
jgi:hypothetical protein